MGKGGWQHGFDPYGTEIVAAYRDFGDRIQIFSPTSFDTVKNAVESRLGKFTKMEILEFCPSLSASAAGRHLKGLTAEGEREKIGGGRTTMFVGIAGGK